MIAPGNGKSCSTGVPKGQVSPVCNTTVSVVETDIPAVLIPTGRDRPAEKEKGKDFKPVAVPNKP